MRFAFRRPATVLLALSLPGLALAGGRCESIDGLAERIAPGRILLLGELHGTRQSPAFASSVACAVAGSGTELVVGLELAPSAQEQVDRYLDSPGEPADREAVLQHTIWQRSYQDGRNSAAMLDLIERVRLLRQAGSRARILLFDASNARGGQAREVGMADNIAVSALAGPDAVHVILAGNMHSRISPGNRRDPNYEPMGYLLRQQVSSDRILALDVAHEGGTAWLCSPECGVVSLVGRDTGPRWSIEVDDETRPSGHQGWYHVGTLSASPPAVGDFDIPQESPVPSVPVETVAEQRERKTEPLDSPAVEKWQGSWQAYQNGVRSWTIEVDGLNFSAVVSPDDWYRGTLFVRPGDPLSEIDFLIEECVCGYKGESSDAIYRWDGDSVTVSTPMPGTRRPTFFNEQKGEVVQLRRIED